MAQDLKALGFWPVVQDVAQEEDVRALGGRRLRFEERVRGE